VACLRSANKECVAHEEGAPVTPAPLLLVRQAWCDLVAMVSDR
jgi:hypothetical protein